jgi:ubiquitin carboxyl-terminal hydrolase 14
MSPSCALLTSSCRLKCDEAPEEEPIVSREPFLKLECNIIQGTNYMESGVKEVFLLSSISVSSADTHLQNLDQKIEKDSTSLGRSAIYSQKTRISRLPSTLLVHMVRFYWRRDINKKAKIMVYSLLDFQCDVLICLSSDESSFLTSSTSSTG